MAEVVVFDPPLWLQRQAWVLSQLHIHEAQTIFEVGCSTAPLLHAVLPPSLYRYPSAEWRAKGRLATRNEKHTIFQEGTIAPRKLIALDVDLESLQEPISFLKKEQQRHGTAETSDRWHDFYVKIICGGLQQDFRKLVGDIDVAVATEVIEHLEESVLSLFASSLLGNYRPRVLLVTTPNYSFNHKFGKDGCFPDPTGQTSRYFRHDDHKFEWTPSEFTAWCQDAAHTHGYKVTISGIGENISGHGPTTYIKDDHFATQTAVFVRHSHDRYPPQTICRTDAALPDADLDVNFIFPAGSIWKTSEQDKDATEADIIEITKDALRELGENTTGQQYEADVWTIWMDREVRQAVQGEIDRWFLALEISFQGDELLCTGPVRLRTDGKDLVLSAIIEDEGAVTTTAAEVKNVPTSTMGEQGQDPPIHTCRLAVP